MVASSLVAERYRILDRIGEGGTGVVYRVEDLTDGQIRALKVLPRAAGRAHLRGEFLALARLRHDNIVRVFDYGVTERGDDWFTMELVRGGDILAAAPPVGHPALFPLVGGILRALSFLHARGIVHADLKPSNILVDEAMLATAPARAARLVDFGLAAHSDDPGAAAARGTLSYAAPEVFAGRLDTRSDLYAFGVVLYELATGHKPFDGADAAQVVGAQRRGPPADPRTFRPELPAGLAELILALTDPEPAARLQTADEALARINDIGGTDFQIDDVRPIVDLTGALVGRERDLGALRQLWEGARGGAGAVALLVGEEGIGKSRLLGELKLDVQLGGGRFYGFSAAARAGAPNGGISDLVRAILVDFGERHPALVASRQAALAPLLSPSRARDADPEARFALAEAVAGLLLDVAALEPLALTVDDLQAAEPGTLELFAYLARAAPSGRILLCGAARGDRADLELAPLVEGLADVARLSRFDLPPLDRQSVRALLTQMFGAEIAAVLSTPLHRSSGGNPAFLARAIALLVEQDALGRRRGQWVLFDSNPAIPLPVDAVAAAQARLAALAEPLRRVVITAAVLGERFEFATLVRAAGGDEPHVSDALGAAIVARLVEGESGGRAFVFVHRGVRESILGALEPEARLALHRVAVSALEEGGAPASARAEQYLALGDDERAITCSLAAAEEHLAAGDFQGARAWYERAAPLARPAGALANPPTALDDDARNLAQALRDRTALIEERLGDLRAALGEPGLAIDDFRRAHTLRQGQSRGQIRIALKLADLLRRRGDWDAATETLRDALAQSRTESLSADEASCHYSLARVRMYAGDYAAAAAEHATAGLALASATGERDLAAHLSRARADVEIFRGDARAALAHLENAAADAADASELVRAEVNFTRGRAAIHVGDYPRAIEALERAIEAYRRLGRVVDEAKSFNNLGAACFFQGEWDRARTSWERFLHLCERVGEPQELVSALNNLGALQRDRGELSEAAAFLDRALRIAERIGRPHIASMIIGNLGEVRFRQGDLVAARDAYRRALDSFESLGAREDTIETRRRLCELDLVEGRLNQALDRAIDSARDAQQAGARLEEGILHRVAASALRRQGDLDSATWFLERSREILTTLGARYERAKVDMEAVELAQARGRSGDAETALASATEVFIALGARWDLAQARSRRPKPQGRVIATAALGGDRPSRIDSMSWRHLALTVSPALEAVLEVARASGTMDIEKVLEIVLDRILEVTVYERGFILLLDERGRPTERMRRTRGRTGLTKGTMEPFDPTAADFSGSIVRRVVDTGEALAVTDVEGDDALRRQVSVISLGLRSVMCAPMRQKGRVTGIVYVDSRRLGDPATENGLAVLEALASQASIAVENARLVAEEQRKTELMAILAHEIRNPLAGILGFASLSESEEKEFPPDALDLFTRIRRDGERMKRLVDNILELARVEAGKVEWSLTPVVVDELLADVDASFTPLSAKRNIRLVVERPPTLPAILGSVDRLFQVLSNLIGNALKFTPAGGTITVRASVERRTVPKAGGEAASAATAGTVDRDLSAWLSRAEGDEQRTYVRFEVADTGPGLPPDRRERLFEKFAQGDKGRAHGVGLGLYISREIVRHHGGEIWVEGIEGQGATFCFRLPAGVKPR